MTVLKATDTAVVADMVVARQVHRLNSRGLNKATASEAASVCATSDEVVVLSPGCNNRGRQLRHCNNPVMARPSRLTTAAPVSQERMTPVIALC